MLSDRRAAGNHPAAGGLCAVRQFQQRVLIGAVSISHTDNGGSPVSPDMRKTFHSRFRNPAPIAGR